MCERDVILPQGSLGVFFIAEREWKSGEGRWKKLAFGDRRVKEMKREKWA